MEEERGVKGGGEEEERWEGKEGRREVGGEGIGEVCGSRGRRREVQPESGIINSHGYDVQYT